MIKHLLVFALSAAAALAGDLWISDLDLSRFPSVRFSLGDPATGSPITTVSAITENGRPALRFRGVPDGGPCRVALIVDRVRPWKPHADALATAVANWLARPEIAQAVLVHPAWLRQPNVEERDAMRPSSRRWTTRSTRRSGCCKDEAPRTLTVAPGPTCSPATPCRTSRCGS